MTMQIPSIRVLSPALELLGEFDAYTSLQFSRLWQGVGDFEFHLFGELDERVLAQGNLVLLDADGTRAGIIRSVEQDDGEGGVTVTVYAQTCLLYTSGCSSCRGTTCETKQNASASY